MLIAFEPLLGILTKKTLLTSVKNLGAKMHFTVVFNLAFQICLPKKRGKLNVQLQIIDR